MVDVIAIFCNFFIKTFLEIFLTVFNIIIVLSTSSRNLEKKNDRVPIPVGVNATLREYQHVGYNYMLQMGNNNLGVCLADDIGLGKTLQTLSIIHLQMKKIAY